MSRRGAPKNGDQVEIINTRIKRPCTTNVQRLVTRRREPHEIPSRTYAIYNQCRECRGWEGDGRSLAEEVAACPNDSCLLWPLRCRNASEKSLYRPSEKRGPNLPPDYSDSDLSTKKGVKPSYNVILRQSFNRSRVIIDFCTMCQCLKPGESRDPIQRCSSPQCWIYPWRTGKLDTDTYEPETLEDLERRVEAESRERGKTG